MDFRPNVDAALWFAQEVLPLIRQEEPDARFVIVGQKPHRRLDVLRDRADVTAHRRRGRHAPLHRRGGHLRRATANGRRDALQDSGSGGDESRPWSARRWGVRDSRWKTDASW